jgi:hypothetical protein
MPEGSERNRPQTIIQAADVDETCTVIKRPEGILHAAQGRTEFNFPKMKATVRAGATLANECSKTNL